MEEMNREDKYIKQKLENNFRSIDRALKVTPVYSKDYDFLLERKKMVRQLLNYKYAGSLEGFISRKIFEMCIKAENINPEKAEEKAIIFDKMYFLIGILKHKHIGRKSKLFSKKARKGIID